MGPEKEILCRDEFAQNKISYSQNVMFLYTRHFIQGIVYFISGLGYVSLRILVDLADRPQVCEFTWHVIPPKVATSAEPSFSTVLTTVVVWFPRMPVGVEQWLFAVAPVPVTLTAES